MMGKQDLPMDTFCQPLRIIRWTWSGHYTAGLLQANTYLEESLNENSFYDI